MASVKISKMETFIENQKRNSSKRSLNLEAATLNWYAVVMADNTQFKEGQIKMEVY